VSGGYRGGVELVAGLQWGALTAAAGLGLRHGFDWDHIAAITDITSSQDATRRSLALSTLYIVGHGLVITVLGLAAVLAGARIPAGLDEVMGRVVGATLIVLGVYVVVSLVRHGRAGRMQSRWMLALHAVRTFAAWWRRRGGAGVIEIEHDHEHPVDEPHPGGPAPVLRSGHPGAIAVASRHSHRHVHRAAEPEDPFPTYGRGTAFGVGMLHGVGAETPTQMMIFVGAAGAGGAAAGTAVLLAFVLGLMASNTVVAVLARAGVLGASGNTAVYVIVSVVVAAVSLYLGSVFLFGLGEGLPGLFT